MSKVIAVWGAPFSGKTAFSVKLANAIYEKYVTTVIVLFTDCETPMMNIICGERYDGVRSIGELLAKPVITRSEVLSYVVTKKRKENFGLMGYKSGDNPRKYPEYTESQVESLLDALKDLADVVIVDCTSTFKDALSRVAIRKCDDMFTLCTADVKSLCFLESEQAMSRNLAASDGNPMKKECILLNTVNKDRYQPEEEIQAYIPGVKYVIPYSKEISDQFENGDITQTLTDRKTAKVFTEIATKEVANSGR